MSVKTSKGLFAAVLSKLDEDEKQRQALSDKARENSDEQNSAAKAGNTNSQDTKQDTSQNTINGDNNNNVQDSQRQELRSNSPHLMKVAAGVKEMQERSKLADDLLRKGQQIVELDPYKIHPSLIKDRLESLDDEAEIAALAASISERGQIVPGLVRPIKGKSDEFEIVYGRRRLLAAKRLGIAFKAAIRILSDEEAIIFQGEENTARNDLSFIEKCLFAKAQEDAGFKRDTICASLSTGKSHISEMIKLAKLVSPALLSALGKAEMIGRGRWLLLAKNFGDFSDEEQASIINACIDRAGFSALSSEEKFAHFLTAFDQQKDSRKNAMSTPKRPKLKKTNDLSADLKWQSKDQRLALHFNRERAVLSLNSQAMAQADKPIQPIKQNPSSALLKSEQHAQTTQKGNEANSGQDLSGFVEFLAGELDGLYSAYQTAHRPQLKKGDR